MPPKATSSGSAGAPSSGNGNTTASDSKPKPKTMRVIESKGDLFSAPAGSILTHACNCTGSWGAGIAAVFASKFPRARAAYQAHCANERKQGRRPDMPGTALLISPVDAPKADPAKGFWVGCLFTSSGYGRRLDGRTKILDATGKSVRVLLERWKEEKAKGKEVGDVYMNMINSGLFRVPWEQTRRVLEEIEVEEGWPEVIYVMVQ